MADSSTRMFDTHTHTHEICELHKAQTWETILENALMITQIYRILAYILRDKPNGHRKPLYPFIISSFKL